jgi:hypothetical protein
MNNLRSALPLILTTIVIGLSVPGCASDRSNAINKNRILAMSPGNKQRTCEPGYALACESSQGHIRYCSCLDREMLRDVIPPDPAR